MWPVEGEEADAFGAIFAADGGNAQSITSVTAVSLDERRWYRETDCRPVHASVERQ